jgi:hypothetical protein
MADEVAEVPPPPIYVVCVGRKGQGKSELAWALWESWDGDRVVIDTTGSVGELHPEEETEDLFYPCPDAWPEELRDDDRRLSLRYVPDHSAPDFREDMDRVVGMAFAQGNCLLWIEESGILAPANRVPPHTRAANHMGRHQRLSKIDTMPRLMDVDPLIPAQADLIYAFDLPNPADRKRLADVTGHDQATVEAAMRELVDHGYVRFHAKEHEVAVFPPIPLRAGRGRQRVARAYIEDHPEGPHTP